MTRNVSINSIKNYFFDRRWAFAAVLIGTVIGFISAVICVYANLVIFGFNIMFIVSPIIAGFMETYIARRKYGKSTGAVSALLIFIIINIYGWFFPQNPITLNLFTLGGLGLMIQAAFPILINYIILVVFIGTLTYILGYLGDIITRLIFKFRRKKYPERTSEEDISKYWAELRNLGVLTTTTTNFERKKIVKYLGVVEGEFILDSGSKKESTRVKRNADAKRINFQKNLEKAQISALKNLIENAKEQSANGVLEVQINFNDLGGLKGSKIMVTASGTAVVYK